MRPCGAILMFIMIGMERSSSNPEEKYISHFATEFVDGNKLAALLEYQCELTLPFQHGEIVC